MTSISTLERVVRQLTRFNLFFNIHWYQFRFRLTEPVIMTPRLATGAQLPSLNMLTGPTAAGLSVLRTTTSCSVQLYYSEYSCTLQLLPTVRKYVFAYFLFHVSLWIILDVALNIPIFSRYLRQQYQKTKLQFNVLKLRTRKLTDNESQNNTNGDWIIPNVKGAFEILHSYKKLKHIHIFAHWNLSCGISARKKSGLLLQCSQRSFISERSGVSEQWRLPLSLRLSGNCFWTRPVAQYSWVMTSYCQKGD